MKSKLTRRLPLLGLAVLLAVLTVSGAHLAVSAESSSAPMTEKVSAAASDAEKKVEAAGNEAANLLDQLWQRIDEKRLKNRTRDEIVAWLLMGLLVAAILHRISKFSMFTNSVL